jgi:hypothetical protein
MIGPTDLLLYYKGEEKYNLKQVILYKIVSTGGRGTKDVVATSGRVQGGGKMSAKNKYCT